MFLKILVALLLVAHGLGHVMAPQSAFAAPGAFPRSASAVLGPRLTIVSRGGKALSLLWLIPLVGFVLGTYGLWTGQGWWRPVLIVSAVVSLVAVLPWWNVMPRFSYLGALAADVLVLVGAFTPWGADVAKAFG
jgi:hypothetical protein